VPVRDNSDEPFSLEHHRKWDLKVQKIAGGLSIMKPLKGIWIHEGAAYRDEMIPVRIACEREQIERIIALTLDHYDQKEVMAYHLSDVVIKARR
jgi:hypothetical protein